MSKSIDELFIMISSTEEASFDPGDVVSCEDIIDELSRMESIDQTDRTGMNLLMFAACHERVKLVEYLIERGINIDFRDNYGNTALHLAVQSDSIDIVKILIDNGADVNAVDNNGNPPLVRCTYATPLVIFKALIENGADPYLKNNYEICAADIYCARADIMKILESK